MVGGAENVTPIREGEVGGGCLKVYELPKEEDTDDEGGGQEGGGEVYGRACGLAPFGKDSGGGGDRVKEVHIEKEFDLVLEEGGGRGAACS